MVLGLCYFQQVLDHKNGFDRKRKLIEQEKFVWSFKGLEIIFWTVMDIG